MANAQILSGRYRILFKKEGILCTNCNARPNTLKTTQKTKEINPNRLRVFGISEAGRSRSCMYAVSNQYINHNYLNINA
jgi:hypothetical protein